LRAAIENGTEEKIQTEFDKWEPVIPFGYDEDEVADMIENFGETVERIENSEFAPPDIKRLESKMPGMKTNFATHVCRNCDVRYSCSSYREYMKKTRNARKDNIMKFMAPTASEQDEFVEGCLQSI
jgi:hypothetical protein